jgi:hypothetical protein
MEMRATLIHGVSNDRVEATNSAASFLHSHQLFAKVLAAK